jgi:hypothetical protein
MYDTFVKDSRYDCKMFNLMKQVQLYDNSSKSSESLV